MGTTEKQIVCASLIPSSRYVNEDFSFHHSMLPTDQHFTELEFLSGEETYSKLWTYFTISFFNITHCFSFSLLHHHIIFFIAYIQSYIPTIMHNLIVLTIMHQVVKTVELVCSIYRGLAETPPLVWNLRNRISDLWPLTPVIVVFVDPWPSGLTQAGVSGEKTQREWGKQGDREKMGDVDTDDESDISNSGRTYSTVRYWTFLVGSWSIV